jgi:hypothetical protein
LAVGVSFLLGVGPVKRGVPGRAGRRISACSGAPACPTTNLDSDYVSCGHVCRVWAHTGAVSDASDDGLLPGLPGAVVERLRAELGARAEKVVGCLRTAVALMAQAEVDTRGLRLAESAAYNLRELGHRVETTLMAADRARRLSDYARTRPTRLSIRYILLFGSLTTARLID